MSFKDWEKINLGDVAIKITKGTTPSTIKSGFVDYGISFFKSECLTESKLIDKSKECYIDEKTHIKMKRSQLQESDILLSMAGAYLGKIALVTKEDVPANINQAISLIRLNQNKAYSQYIYYYLSQKNVVKYINSVSSQSAQPNINLKQIGEIPIILPPIEEQKAIAKILSDLDDKIEVNNKINKRLEDMAQAIFKHWFVDFEFPNEEGKPYKSSGGEIVESELGMIPKGWEVKSLEEVAEFQNGYAFYKEGYSDTGIKVIDLANVNSLGNFVETNRDKYISYDLYNQEKLKKYRLNKDDLIIIMTDRTQDMNILGKTAKIPYSNKFILNQRVGRLKAINGINVNFLLSYMNSPVILDELKSISLGSVQKYFNTSHIKALRFIIPNQNIMDLYSSYIDSIYNQMFVLNEEIIKLSNLRDTLLPKLMSGEIRVPID